jgi:hypothetical protein
MIISNDSAASRTIRRFGGITSCAKALSKPKSTVQRWKDSGFIHPDYYPEILAAAVAEGVVLDVHDFNTVNIDHPAFNAPIIPSPDSTADRAPAASDHPIPDTEQSLQPVHGSGDRVGVPAVAGG